VIRVIIIVGNVNHQNPLIEPSKSIEASNSQLSIIICFFADLYRFPALPSIL
jgi:hypothetical protein